MSCAPRLISRSLSGNRQEMVSRESSLNSMISISSPRMKSMSPMGGNATRMGGGGGGGGGGGEGGDVGAWGRGGLATVCKRKGVPARSATELLSFNRKAAP